MAEGFWKFVWKVFLATIVINIIIFAIILVFALFATIVSAEPEPSLGFRISHWWEEKFPSLTFSVNSDYQSFVRWNPNFNECKYYTGLCDSIAQTTVADSYCTVKEYVKEYKTITTEDERLLILFQSCGATTGGGSTGGEIGDPCTTASDCGLACTGRTNCEPRCLYDSYLAKRICFAGDTTGVYGTICAAASDCESEQTCQNGICTTPNYDTGNPTGGVNTTQICTVVNCNTKCTDNTPVAQCSTTKPEYCMPLDSHHDTAMLVPLSSVCGCPSGQRQDSGGKTCCTFPNCLNCNAGEYQTKTCPDGSEIIRAKCVNTYWQTTSAICPVEDEQQNSSMKFILIIIAIIFFTLSMILLIIYISKKR